MSSNQIHSKTFDMILPVHTEEEELIKTSIKKTQDKLLELSKKLKFKYTITVAFSATVSISA